MGAFPFLVEAVSFLEVFRLIGQIHQLGHFDLHTIGQLVIRNGRLEGIVFARPLQVLGIQFAHEAKLGLLDGVGGIAAHDV